MKMIGNLFFLLFFALPLYAEPLHVLLNWMPEPEHGGLYAAHADKLFAQRGLDVIIKPGGAMVNPMAALVSENADVSISDAAAILMARDKGMPVTAFFATYDTHPQVLMFHKENPIKDFADLAGRTVAITPGAAYWDYLQKKYRLKGKVKQINYSGQIALFLQDKALVTQAYAHAEPYFAKKEGARVDTLIIARSGFNPYGNVYAVKEGYLKSHAQTIQAFFDALQEGWQRYLANPKRYDQVLMAANRQLDADFLHWAAQAQKPFIASEPGTMHAQRWQDLAKELADLGLIKKDLDIDNAFWIKP